MTDEQARQHLKQHCAAWGDAKYEPARWAVEALQSAVAAERERCAKLAEAMDADYLRTSPCRKALSRVAAAIRRA